MFRAEFDRIIERQMRNWELARSQAAAPQAVTAEGFREFIAISRQKASGGLTLARALGDELGWQVFDTEIIDYMAGNNALQQRIYEMADEQGESYFETLLRGMDLDAHTPRYDYFRKLVRSIRVLARSTHAIFVGRGAHLVLPRRCGLLVRVIAPASRRIAQHAKETGCTLNEAAEVIRRTDQDRDGFIREHFNVNPQSPHLYDLVINFERLSMPAALRIVVAALGDKTGYTPRVPELAVG
jgi:cytidylate kinase